MGGIGTDQIIAAGVDDINSAAWEGAFARAREWPTQVDIDYHDPEWPPAPGTSSELPAPSASRVPDTTWAQVRLTPAELAVKEDALSRYRSQVEVMADLFRRFQRENELFGRVKSEVLAKIAAVH